MSLDVLRRGLLVAGPVFGMPVLGMSVAQPASAQNSPSPEPTAQPATADDPAPQIWALHGQSTFEDQYHPAFASGLRGPNSLDPGSRGNETFDATLYAGVRPWSGGELWLNPEIDQGFGLSDTLGIAAYPSAEAYKVGEATPYVRLPRLFLRQTIDLGGAAQRVEPDLNVLGGTQTADKIVVTIGKFSLPDVFDANAYAHDPRQDFSNWALVDTATFDYAADAWGYSYGAAAEWYHDWWTLRGGAFTLSRVPNSRALDTSGGQVQFVAEAEERHTIMGQAGKLRLLGYLTRGRMGDFNEATSLALESNTPADLAATRNYRSRTGMALNLEQALTKQLGLFVRAGIAEGGREVYEFTDVNKTFAVGLALQGAAWGRPADTVGLATVVDDISRRYKNFLAAGGLGILVGDGALPSSGPEQVVESYYSYAVTGYAHVTADYQFVNNPAYDRARGPVSILGARLHVQY
jgi:high affinity Mn2+ porin